MQDTLALLKRLFGEELKILILLSLATVVFALPVVTAGPALLAMNSVLIRLADDRCGRDWFAEFRAVFKAKFWRGVQLEGLVALYVLAMLYSVALADNLAQGGQVVWTLLYASLLLAGMVGVWLVPLLSESTLPFFQAFWDAVRLAFVRLPRSILAMIVVYSLCFAFVLLYPASVLVYSLFVLAAMAAMSVAVVWPAIDELIFPEEPES